MIALTVGVDEGAGDGVVVTGHTLGIGDGVAVGVRVAVGVTVKGSSDSAAPFCAKAAIETTSRTDSSTRHRSGVEARYSASRRARKSILGHKKNGAPRSLELQFGDSDLAKP